MDLVTFLTARLDEDEQYARVMTEVGERKALAATPDDIADMFSLAVAILDDSQAKALIARWMESGHLQPSDLKRVLRQVEAGRKILAMREEQHGYDLPPGVYEGRDQPERERDEALLDMLDDVIRVLASVYSDHEDYREEWKP